MGRSRHSSQSGNCESAALHCASDSIAMSISIRLAQSGLITTRMDSCTRLQSAADPSATRPAARAPPKFSVSQRSRPSRPESPLVRCCHCVGPSGPHHWSSSLLGPHRRIGVVPRPERISAAPHATIRMAHIERRVERQGRRVAVAGCRHGRPKQTRGPTALRSWTPFQRTLPYNRQR